MEECPRGLGAGSTKRPESDSMIGVKTMLETGGAWKRTRTPLGLML